MNYSGFSSKNTIIHRMNPSLKFLSTVLVIAMIFIPFGFVYQAILLVFCLTLYFMAKLPLKKLWRIVESIIVLAIILALINWVSYKDPGIIFDFKSHYYFFYTPSFLNWDSSHVTSLDGVYFLQGSMYGGEPAVNAISGSGQIGNGYVTEIGNGFYKIEILSDKAAYSEVDDIIKSLRNSLTTNYSGWNVKYASQVSQEANNIYYVYFYVTKWYTYSSYAIILMLYVSIKIFLMILIVTILTSTTSSIQLTCALEDILNPLKYLRLPITEWSMTIALVLRFIPSLLDESNRILKAQASRGLDFKNGNLKDKMSSLTSLVVPMFSIAFKKASELSNAMEARGYNPRYTRTRYRDYDIRRIDWVIFAIATFLFGILIALVTLKGRNVFISFGFWDIFAT